METTTEFGKHMRLATKVIAAGEGAGFTSKQWNALAENAHLFPQLAEILDGNAQIQMTKPVIDCDAEPFVPAGWKGIEKHVKGGALRWEPQKVKLWTPTRQFSDLREIEEELSRLPSTTIVLNACVLDHLSANRHLIPQGWKEMLNAGKAIIFWNTFFQIWDSRPGVRSLGLERDGEKVRLEGAFPLNEGPGSFCFWRDTHFIAIYDTTA